MVPKAMKDPNCEERLIFTSEQRRMIKNRITGDPILADPYGRDYQMADGIIIRLRRNSRI